MGILNKEKLRDFLKENDCHDQFVNNFKKEYRNVIKSPNLSNFLDSGDPKMWVRRAFDWGSTAQGADYWSNVNKGWLNALSNSVDNSDSFNE